MFHFSFTFVLCPLSGSLARSIFRSLFRSYAPFLFCLVCSIFHSFVFPLHHLCSLWCSLFCSTLVCSISCFLLNWFPNGVVLCDPYWISCYDLSCLPLSLPWCIPARAAPFKALVNEDTLLPMMFLGLCKLGNICCGHKMFLNKIRNFFCVPDTKFVSATNVVRAGKRGNICVRNNVSSFARAFKFSYSIRFPPLLTPSRLCFRVRFLMQNTKRQNPW